MAIEWRIGPLGQVRIKDDAKAFPEVVVKAICAWLSAPVEKRASHANVRQPDGSLITFENGEWETGPRKIAMGVSVEKDKNYVVLPSLVFAAAICTYPPELKDLIIVGPRIGVKRQQGAGGNGLVSLG